MKSQPATSTHIAGPHPLDAVPRRVPGVMARTGSDGGLHLRREVPPSGPIDAFVRRTLRTSSDVRLAIDANGKCFWDLIDGQRTLREIAALLAVMFKKPEAEANEAVLLFTGVLMQRNFLFLEVSEAATQPQS